MKKYTYVEVWFVNGNHPYTYRTEDTTISINTVVMVPAGDEVKPAIVSSVNRYREEAVPYPLDETKEIIGKADRKTRKLFKGMDFRMSLDISVKTVETTSGHAVVVTDNRERNMLRLKYGTSGKVRLVESEPVSKAYEVLSRDDQGKRNRKGYWKEQEHLFGEITYQCSRCKSVFSDREAFCPKCHSENRKVSHDPVWIDEMEFYDEDES